jgi:predicted DsbA family dithiol-disulfide isomerase
MAWENPQITGDMVEAMEFPYLAHRYNVMGVPRTMINETDYIEGAVPEQIFISHVMNALQKKTV